MLEKLEEKLASGRDDALLRFSLGKAYLDRSDPEAAIRHFARATELDASYSAAWKLLGKALQACRRDSEAEQAWVTGVEAARAKGDIQVAREMEIFLKRMRRQPQDGSIPPGSP